MPIKIEDYITPIGKISSNSNTGEQIKIEDYITPIKTSAITPQQINIKDFLMPIESIKLDNKDDAFSKMSKFQKVLDILGRPGYAVKSVLQRHQAENAELIKNMPKTGDIGKDKLSETKLLGQKKLQLGKDLEAAWKGLSGQERVTANELWENVGVKGVPFLGFITELGTDPMLAAGGAGYKAITKTIGKGIELTGKGIKAIPGVTKGLEVAAEKIQPVTSALKEMFITKTGIGKLGDLIEQHLSKREYLKGKEMKFGIKTRNVIQNISKKTGQSVDDVEKQIVNLIEQPQITPSGVPQESIALANVLKSHLTNMLTKEMKAGVPISSLSENVRGIQYFPRITTKEATEYLKQARIGNSRVWNTKLANALRRKTGDFTLQEFNDFVASQGLKSLGGKSVEEFFMQNPAYAITTRGIRSAKAVTSAEFLNDVGKQFGLQQAPEFWQELPDTITKLNPSLKGLKFDPEIMSEVTRVTKSYIDPQELGVFRKGFDAIQNLWKRWTLAPFPKYHLRNMVGNMWNNYLAGIDVNNYRIAEALQGYRKFKGKGNVLEKNYLMDLKRFGLTSQQADDVILNAEKTGVLGQGWYGADIETTIERAMKRTPKYPSIQWGMNVGTTIENNARLAHYLDRLNKGDDTLTAAKSVKKYLFDYQDLTQFERQIMKRAMPFYTWTRKNIPLQLQNIWEQPQKYATLSPLLRNRDPQDLLRLKYSQPSLYEKFPVELQREIDTVTYVPLEGIISAADLTKMVRPQELLIEMLSPYLKAGIELSINKSFFFEDEIQKYPKETQEILRMDIPVRLKYVITSILPQSRLLNEMNKIVKKKIRKEELTPTEQIFALTLGSVYKKDIKDLRDRALWELEKKVRELEKGMFNAKRNLRPDEQERIKQTYKEIKEEIKNLR